MQAWQWHLTMRGQSPRHPLLRINAWGVSTGRIIGPGHSTMDNVASRYGVQGYARVRYNAPNHTTLMHSKLRHRVLDHSDWWHANPRTDKWGTCNWRQTIPSHRSSRQFSVENIEGSLGPPLVLLDTGRFSRVHTQFDYSTSFRLCDVPRQTVLLSLEVSPPVLDRLVIGAASYQARWGYTSHAKTVDEGDIVLEGSRPSRVFWGGRRSELQFFLPFKSVRVWGIRLRLSHYHQAVAPVTSIFARQSSLAQVLPCFEKVVRLAHHQVCVLVDQSSSGVSDDLFQHQLRWWLEHLQVTVVDVHKSAALFRSHLFQMIVLSKDLLVTSPSILVKFRVLFSSKAKHFAETPKVEVSHHVLVDLHLHGWVEIIPLRIGDLAQ